MSQDAIFYLSQFSNNNHLAPPPAFPYKEVRRETYYIKHHLSVLLILLICTVS